MENVITRKTPIFTDLISKIKTIENEIDAMKEGNLTCSENWLNGEAVMRKLGISRRTLQTYRDNRILPYSVVGGKFYYSVREIEELMKKNYVSASL